MKVFYGIFLVVLGVSFMSGCAQINRDNLRYGAIKRGTEVYKIDVKKDSLEAAKEHNDKEVDLYEKRLKAYAEYLKSWQKDEKKQKQDEVSSGSSDKDKKVSSKKEQQPSTKAVTIPLIPFPDTNSDSNNNQTKIQAAPFTSHLASQLEFIWPKDFINKVVDKNNNEPVNELIGALSSTASVAQMRDLLTEPSFPPLLPVEHQVELGCLPPPDSAAFEAVMNLSANLKNLMVSEAPIDASLSANFATSVVKLFEESERTLFLQYALFRLCEMSVNSPAEFRNVYPVIIHDIVRRTAEMTQLANQKAEERRIEEEKTKQMELSLEMQKTKSDKESLYNSCIKAKLNAGLSDNEKIVAECKTLANSKPE